MRSRSDFYTYSIRGNDGLIHIGQSDRYFIEGCMIDSFFRCDGGSAVREIVKATPNCLTCLADPE